jgi:metal-responsive CopG/Arc/MetJ family transcriptional regulator
MDPQLLAKLDLAKGPVPRSEMVEAAVRAGLELFENMKSMAERYGQAAKVRERRGPK